jgi:hypothetical protein
MVPSVSDKVLRPRNGDGTLSSDEFGKLKSLFHYLVSAALHNFRYQSQFLSLSCREGTRRVGKFAQQGLVTSDLGKKGQRPDIGSETYVDFL